MKNGILVLICWLICSILSGQNWDQPQNETEYQIQSYLDRSHEFEQKGDYYNGFKNFTKAVTLSNRLDSSDVYYIMVNIHLASWLHKIGLLKEAIRKKEVVLSILHRYYPWNRNEQMQIYGSLGGWNIEDGNPKLGLHYFKKSLELSLDKNDSNASSFNNLGWYYLQAGEYDSALYNFRIANQLVYKSPENPNFQYGINDNMGETFLHQKKYDSAFVYFNKCVVLADRASGHMRKTQSHYQLARLFFTQNNFNEAEKELKKSESQWRIAPGDKSEYRLKLSQLWYELLKQTNRSDQALRYHENLVHIKDSISQTKGNFRQAAIELLVSQSLSRMSIELELEKQASIQSKQALIISEQNRQLNQGLAMGIGAISLTLVISGILLFRIRQKKSTAVTEALLMKNKLKEAELRNKQLEQEKLQFQLETKQQDISEMALLLSNLRNLQTSLVKKVADIKKLKPDEQLMELKDVLSDINSRIDHSQKASHVHQHIEDVNTEFYFKLQEKHPTLTKVELELCSLIRLNMKNNEIAAMKNVALPSVKQSKRRLRRKLKLQLEADVNEYLKQF